MAGLEKRLLETEFALWHALSELRQTSSWNKPDLDPVEVPECLLDHALKQNKVPKMADWTRLPLKSSKHWDAWFAGKHKDFSSKQSFSPALALPLDQSVNSGADQLVDVSIREELDSFMQRATSYEDRMDLSLTGPWETHESGQMPFAAQRPAEAWAPKQNQQLNEGRWSGISESETGNLSALSNPRETTSVFGRAGLRSSSKKHTGNDNFVPSGVAEEVVNKESRIEQPGDGALRKAKALYTACSHMYY